MAKLIYFMPTSLDGYIADETGNPDWAAPDEEVFAFINDLVRPIASISMDARYMRPWRFGRRQTSFLIGRRPCWTSRGSGMRPTKSSIPKSLETVSTPKTRLEREFDPQRVRDLKTQSPHDVSVAGPTLAAQAIGTGLVDEYHLLIVPVMLGGGKRVLPSNVCVKLDLLDERRFANGILYLRYHTRA